MSVDTAVEPHQQDTNNWNLLETVSASTSTSTSASTEPTVVADSLPQQQGDRLDSPCQSDAPDMDALPNASSDYENDATTAAVDSDSAHASASATLLSQSLLLSLAETPKKQLLENSVSPGLLATPETPSSSVLPPTSKYSELLGCDEHPHGRPPQSRECPKCDTVLSSARSLGGHMTMSHSRNACKALKCPKCNWSYKYQETLEIHMKEKHPETNSQCMYCASCQPHPRLARGESYSCGYKPYRCEICNYSTTTKGNLSIHMQSDKHINNVQELQNSAAVAAALAAAASINGQPGSPAAQTAASGSFKSLCSSCTKSPCECAKNGLVDLFPPIAPSASPNEDADKRVSGMNANSKPKPVSRCDVCKYETTVPRNLRIHMTSEKHLHNVAMQQQSSQPQSQSQSQSNASQTAASQKAEKSVPEGESSRTAASGSNDQPRESVASNGALQELLAQLAQTRSALGSAGLPSSLPGLSNLSLSPSLLPLLGLNGLSGLNAAATAALMMNSFNVANQLGSFNPLAAASQSTGAGTGANWADLLAAQGTQNAAASPVGSSAADWLRLHAAAAVLSAAYNNQVGANSASTSSAPSASLITPSASSSAIQSTPAVQKTPIGAGVGVTDVVKDRRRSQKLYHCSICNVFSSESLEELQEHIQLDRTNTKQQTGSSSSLQYDPETVQIANGTFMCKLCTYKTTLKANFQLHCKTDKHLQRVQLVNHIKEGGAANDWRLQALLNPAATAAGSSSIAAQTALSNLIQIRCVACDCSTNLLHKLQIHSQTPQHHFNARLFHHLADCEVAADASQIGFGFGGVGRRSQSVVYRCLLCATSENSRAALIAHANSVDHARQLALRSGCSSLNDAEVQQQNSKFIDLFRVELDDGVKNSPDSAAQSLLQTSAKCESVDSSSCCANRNGNASASANANGCGISSGNSQKMVRANAQVSPSAISDINANSNKQFDNCSLSQSQSFAHTASAKAKVACPLCESEILAERCEMEDHLMKVHNVTKEGLHRLLALVSFPIDNPCSSKSELAANQGMMADLHSPGDCESSCDASETLEAGGFDDHEQYRCQICARQFVSIDALYAHQSEFDHLEVKQTPNGPGYLCWKKGCNQYFRSVQAAQTHFREIHDKAKRGLVANPASVNVHNANSSGNSVASANANRLTTFCTICTRNFRSVLALRNHVETIHQNPADGDRCCEANADMCEMTMAESGCEMDGQLDQMSVEFNKPLTEGALAAAKSTPTQAAKAAAVQQPALLNGASVGRYLDPNRPFKCEVCRESFTQRSILLGHFKSVSHLHKLKRQKNEAAAAAAAAAAADQQRSETESRQELAESQHEASASSALPYKCNLCKQSFSEGLSLAAHVKSQTHQNRLSRLYELIAMGEYDLSKPLIENPDDLMKVLWSSLMAAAQKSSSPGSSAGNLLESFTSRVALAAQNSACLASTSGLLSNIAGNEKIDAQVATKPSPSHDEKSPAVDHVTTAVRNSLRLPVSFRKSLMQFGLEQVTQFLESADTRDHHSDDEDVEKDERKLYFCSDCDKEFSSPLVLKCHREFQHNDFMASEALVQVASCLQDNFERRLHVVVPSDCGQMENANAGTNANATPIHSPCHPEATSQLGSPTANMAIHDGRALLSGSDSIATNSAQQQAKIAPPPPPSAVSAVKTLLTNRKNVSLPNATVSLAPTPASLQQQQQQASLLEKRARTRITDEQLRVLRAHFNINNSPNEDEILKMSDLTGLAQKVIKHWFRNTLFKERQRNKDSPYNFSVPPVTSLNLEEYERTGQIKVAPLEPNVSEQQTENDVNESQQPTTDGCEKDAQLEEPESGEAKSNANANNEQLAMSSLSRAQDDDTETHESLSFTQSDYTDDTRDCYGMHFEERNRIADKHSDETRSIDVDEESYSTMSLNGSRRKFSRPVSAFASSTNEMGSNLHLSSKRANRTRFSDEQLAVLQDYFEKRNAYPKDEELEQLSRRLSLNARVIVVWFQNQRQKKHRAKHSLGNAPEPANDVTAHHQQHVTDTVSHSAMLEALSRVVVKRRYEDDELVVEEGTMQSDDDLSDAETERQNGDDKLRRVEDLSTNIEDRSFSKDCPPNKRLRTTISPEQLDLLYQQYQQDSNPTRKRIEEIAESVKLRKRVVQVWFQNARARTRKELQAQIMKRSEVVGNDRGLHTAEALRNCITSPNNSLPLSSAPKRTCPHCPAQFRARSALSSHLKTKHSDVITRQSAPIVTAGIATPEVPNANGPEHNADHVSNTIDDVLAWTTSATSVKLETTPMHMNDQREVDFGLLQRQSSTGQQQDVDGERKLVICDDIMDESGRLDEQNDSAVHGSARSRDSSPDASCSDKLSSDMQVPNGVKLSKNSDAHKRTRTQLSMTQIRMMKAIFKDYRTPTMHECEQLGKDIGLPRRVVQVWYQNARAKERKAKVFGSFGISKKDDEEEKKDSAMTSTCTRCSLCSVDFVSAAQPNGETLQQHLFSAQHLRALRQSLELSPGSSGKQVSDGHDTPRLGGRSSAFHKVRGKRLKAESSENHEVQKNDSTSAKEQVKSSLRTSNSLSVSEASEVTSTNAGESGATNLLNPSMATASLLAASAAAANSVNLLSTLLSPTLNFNLPFSPPTLPNLSVMPYMYAAAAAAAAAAINTAASNNGTATSSNSSNNSNSSPVVSKTPSAASSWQQPQLDATNYGIPVNLLQIPTAAMKSLTDQVKSLDKSTQKCSYTQDSNCLSDMASSVNIGYVDMKPVEVGFICRACSLVFPKQDLCVNHQRTSCSKIKELHADSEQRIIRLEQLQYRCKVCNNAYSTTQDFLQHCNNEPSSHQCLLK